ncbi:MAG: rod shape-determining protein [Clostridia bacterium]|nr:rod shape-determining protein [Clostridia bacterium]
MGFFSKSIGIDLGTASTQIYKKGSGIVLNEPSVVAVDKFDGKVLAVGAEANEMIGRTPDSIVAIRPIKDGVIADFDITRAMLRSFIIDSAVGGILKPKVFVAVPSGITEVEKRAVEEAAVTAGAKSVTFVEEPMAAAIGAGLSVDDAAGNMIVDIGGGTTEVAVISLGGIVASKSVRIAGDALDSAIINFVKKEHGINIGDRMAEEVKIAIGNAFDTGESKQFALRGRDVSTGLPKQETVTSSEIREAMSENMSQIMEAIRVTLEHTPPELAADVMERGIILSGGSAAISGLCELIKSELDIEAHVAEEPQNCVAIGTGLSISRAARK